MGFFNEQIAKLGVECGGFTEVDGGKYFEFVEVPSDKRPWADFPHKIAVGGLNETRFGRVLKTVCYMVKDEAADGSPVVEKWNIRGHHFYKK